VNGNGGAAAAAGGGGGGGMGRNMGGSGAANGASGRRPVLASSPDADTLRILVATDNHLGYNEVDPIRGCSHFLSNSLTHYLITNPHALRYLSCTTINDVGNDSFRTFEEIFQIAVDNQVPSHCHNYHTASYHLVGL
jgi:hypothetical protein